MKKQVLLIAILLCSSILTAQDYAVLNVQKKAQKQSVALYDVPEKNNVYVFASEFAKDVILSDNIPLELRNADIYQIDYVYTAYKAVDTFSQKQLNLQRLNNLYKIFPEIFDYNMVKWNFLEQTAPKDTAAARKAFHGFVFYTKTFNSDSAFSAHLSEIDSLDKIFADYFGDTIVSYKPVTVEKIKYLPRLKYKRKKGIIYDKKSIWNRKELNLIDTISYDTIISVTAGRFISIDTVLFSVLHRNKSWNYDSAVVVMDVTGSMWPYIAQMLIWTKKFYQKTNKIRFVFFNDGDRHPDGPIGHSGGYYSVDTKNFDVILDSADYTMSRGCGGLGPENDIEAMIYAQKRFPNAKFIILIADNYARVRDMTLLKKIKKPVKVVLCGTNNNVNTQYLEIAYRTHGSIHTIEEDIENLSNLKSDDVLEINGKKYRFKNGKFYQE